MEGGFHARGGVTIYGHPVSNRDALMNPEVLDFYAAIEEVRKD